MKTKNILEKVGSLPDAASYTKDSLASCFICESEKG